MPIYAYRCAACGHTKDVLRKMSDPPLSDCPACGEPCFEKQVTAAGFQLKGSGWYATDFRNPPAAAPKAGADGAKAEGGEETKPTTTPSDGAGPAAPATPATPAPPPTPAAAAAPAAKP